MNIARALRKGEVGHVRIQGTYYSNHELRWKVFDLLNVTWDPAAFGGQGSWLFSLSIEAAPALLLESGFANVTAAWSDVHGDLETFF